MKRKEILENRRKFIKGLQESHRLKIQGTLESPFNPNARCCLGHGCDILGLEKGEREGRTTYENHTAIAPNILCSKLGLRDCFGVFEGKFTYDGEEIDSLVSLNDSTDVTTQEIGKILEPMIEGGKGTPFIHINNYE